MTSPNEPTHLHYVGTSGYQDTDTSRSRAAIEDGNGTTARMQTRIMLALAEVGPVGLTVLEARRRFGIDNPNRVAPSFTNLHKGDLIARLDEARERHLVYVLPGHVGDRPEKPSQ